MAVEGFPFIVGVTGHRDPRPVDVPRLERELHETFAEVAAAVPHSPRVLWSCLAVGADRLAARVAMAEGIPVVAVLPMAVSDYQRDFQDDSADAAEFEELLSLCRSTVILPAPPEPKGVARDDCYARAGAWVAHGCHLLIALWDGTTNNLVGGTGQVVEMRLEGRYLGFGPQPRALDEPSVGPVVHVVMPRVSQPESHALEVRRRWLPEKKDVPSRMREVVRAAVRSQPVPVRALDTVRALWRTPMEPHLEAWRAFDAVNAGLAESEGTLFERLDRMAVSNRDATRRVMGLTFASAGIAAASAVLTPHLRAAIPWLGYSQHAALVALYAVIAVAYIKRYQSRYLDCRLVAEGLRIQSVWCEAGSDAAVADHYQDRQVGELGWIRLALQSVAPAPGRSASIARIEAVQRTWIRDQASYYREKQTRNSRMLGRWRLVRDVLVVGGSASGLAAALVPAPTASVILVGAALAQALGALAAGWISRMAFDEEANACRRMARLFDRADTLLTHHLEAGDLTTAEEIVVQVGREALAEHADWLMLHRARPVSETTRTKAGDLR